MKDDLGDRMKGYENVTRTSLVKRMPVILRIDGKAFHTFTRQMDMDKPFDDVMKYTMEQTMKYLCENIQNAKFGYTQSDEISILMTDYDKLTTEPWFGNTIQKIVSVAASMATAKFNQVYSMLRNDMPQTSMATFDCRAFNIPKDEVVNYFIWRQKDAIRNSVSMYGQSNFSSKELNGVGTAELICKLFNDADIDWYKAPEYNKQGSGCVKKTRLGKRPAWEITEVPRFTDNRNCIGDLI